MTGSDPHLRAELHRAVSRAPSKPARRPMPTAPRSDDVAAALPPAIPRAGAPATGRHITDTEIPLWQRAGLEVQRALTEDSRNKEIAAPPDAEPKLANDVVPDPPR